MSANFKQVVKEALSLIESAGLPHPSSLLLSSFIIEALDPPLAAQYVLPTCRSGDDEEADLFSIVSDWSYIVESSTSPTCTLAFPSLPSLMTDQYFSIKAWLPSANGRCCRSNCHLQT